MNILIRIFIILFVVTAFKGQIIASERLSPKSDTLAPQSIFKFYRKEIDLFLVPPSAMKVYVHRYDKYDLLEKKLSLLSKEFELSVEDIKLKDVKIRNLQEQNDNYLLINTSLRDALRETEKQLEMCNNLNGEGELSIQSLQLQLKKERIKYTWYSIGGGTMAAAMAIIAIEILKR